jgi:alpha-N-arabinofuranosidase
VEIACFSPIVNARGAIYVHPKGIVKRTTFHVFDLYANKLERNVLPIDISSEIMKRDNKSTPVIDAILTCNDARTRFALAIVNKSPEEAVDFRPDFKGLHLQIPGKINGTVLCGTTPDDFNDIGAEDRVIPVQRQFEIINGAISLPPHSLAFFNFE